MMTQVRDGAAAALLWLLLLAAGVGLADWVQRKVPFFAELERDGRKEWLVYVLRDRQGRLQVVEAECRDIGQDPRVVRTTWAGGPKVGECCHVFGRIKDAGLELVAMHSSHYRHVNYGPLDRDPCDPD